MAEYHLFNPKANIEKSLVSDSNAINSLQLIEVEGFSSQ